MKIQKIALINFKNFIKDEFYFDDITYLKGINGSGKSTIGLESILFSLWGYTPKQTLNALPTRNVAKFCTVKIEILHNNSSFEVIRQFPSELTILKNTVKLKFNTITEAQRYLDETFGTREHFQQFRILDNEIGCNFLAEGQIALKRILFSHLDEYFNNIRNKLAEIKREREIYNKDAIVNTHHPSEVRLEILEINLQEFEEKLNSLIKDLNPLEAEYRTCYSRLSQNKEDLCYWADRKKVIVNNKQCYACNRGLPEEKQKEMITEIDNKIENLETAKQKGLGVVNNQQSLIKEKNQQKENIHKKLRKIENLITILKGRLKQKNYKWSQADLEIAKQAIKEIDRISSEYLINQIKSLEPIINSFLNRIGFNLELVTANGKIDIELEKEKIKYNYKDLSCGQKLILQIAFKLALLLQKGESGLIVADEGFSSLSEENLYIVLDIFKNLPFQLIFTLHRDLELENIKIIDLDRRSK